MAQTFEERYEAAMAQVITITAEELQYQIEDVQTLIMIDVRDASDFATGSLPGAINIPLETLSNENWQDERVSDFSRAIVTTCAQGPMGTIAGKTLEDKGFSNVIVLKGGLQTWQNAGFSLS